MTNTVTLVGEHLHRDASVIDDPSARAVLDLLYDLPDRRWDTLGVPILIQDGDVTRPATEAQTLTRHPNPSTPPVPNPA